MMQLLKSKSGLAIAAGFLILFIGGGARFAIGLTLKPMVEELHWGRSEIGSTVAIFQIITAFAMFAAGRAADRMSLRLIIGGGIAVCGVSIGLMGLVTQPWHAFALYGVVFAIGNGVASMTPVSVMVTRAAPDHAGFANGIASAGMSVGQLMIVAVLSAVLVSIGWRSVFFWLAGLHVLFLAALLPIIPGADAYGRAEAKQAPRTGYTLSEAMRTRQFWLLIGIYAICGFDDFFVATHVVAFAQDRGVDAFLAGNLLAMMGLTGLLGVVISGYWGDRSGPVAPTVAAFGARVASFALIVVDQSQLSVAIFALVFGVTFLMTAPLTVLFIRESFGMAHLGAIAGLITMIHHICGGLGAWIGAAVFDASGNYNSAFVLMSAVSIIAVALTLMLRPPGQTKS
jgi:predicted MFS family arabinose efflux permease